MTSLLLCHNTNVNLIEDRTLTKSTPDQNIPYLKIMADYAEYRWAELYALDYLKKHFVVKDATIELNNEENVYATDIKITLPNGKVVYVEVQNSNPQFIDVFDTIFHVNEKLYGGGPKKRENNELFQKDKDDIGRFIRQRISTCNTFNDLIGIVNSCEDVTKSYPGKLINGKRRFVMYIDGWKDNVRGVTMVDLNKVRSMSPNSVAFCMNKKTKWDVAGDDNHSAFIRLQPRQLENANVSERFFK